MSGGQKRGRAGDAGKRSARHADIEARLQRQIEDGTYPLGALLPTEKALCAALSASRFTVRQALAGLRASGLIEARPGYGTFVIRTRPRETITHRMSTFEDLLRYPAQTRRKQIEVSELAISSSLAQVLKLSSGSCWTRLRAMRVVRGSGAAISWLNAYIAPRFADVLDLPNPDGISLLRQIEAHHGHRAAEAQVEVFVSRIEGDLARPLHCAPGDPALIILRRYRGADGLVYLVTHSVHPENRFSLTFDMAKGIAPPPDRPEDHGSRMVEPVVVPSASA